MGVSRRSFLGLGAAGLAVLSLGGVGLALRSTVDVPPADPLKALSPRAFSVLHAVAERICPGGEGFPTASELHTAEAVDALLATMEPGTVTEVEQALFLVENALAGLLLDGRPRTFTSCTPEEQDAILEAWATSRLSLRRKVHKALRGLVAAAYHAHPATFAAVGYPGPPDFSAFLAARAAEQAAEQAAAVAPDAAPPGGAP